MNWYSFKQAEIQSVVVSSWSNEGVVAYIDGKRYFCPGYDPKSLSLLNQLIKVKAWGKAANIIRNWPCERQELKRWVGTRKLDGSLLVNILWVQMECSILVQKKLFKDCLPNVASKYNALGNPYSKNWFQQVMSNNFAFVTVSPNNIQFTSTKKINWRTKDCY